MFIMFVCRTSKNMTYYNKDQNISIFTHPTGFEKAHLVLGVIEENFIDISTTLSASSRHFTRTRTASPNLVSGAMEWINTLCKFLTGKILFCY